MLERLCAWCLQRSPSAGKKVPASNLVGSEIRAMALSGHLGQTSEIKSRVVRVNWLVGFFLGAVLVGGSGSASSSEQKCEE